MNQLFPCPVPGRVWIPVDELPDWLVEVGRVFPLAHLAESLQRAVADPSLGTGLTGENVAVLAAWGIAGPIVAARGIPLGAAGPQRLTEQTFTAR